MDNNQIEYGSSASSSGRKNPPDLEIHDEDRPMNIQEPTNKQALRALDYDDSSAYPHDESSGGDETSSLKTEDYDDEQSDESDDEDNVN